MFIASFAVATLNSSVGVKRYIVSDDGTRFDFLSKKWIAMVFAIFSLGAAGKGFILLWLLLGSVNLGR